MALLATDETSFVNLFSISPWRYLASACQRESMIFSKTSACMLLFIFTLTFAETRVDSAVKAMDSAVLPTKIIISSQRRELSMVVMISMRYLLARADASDITLPRTPRAI